MLICPNCGEELRFWDERHHCQGAANRIRDLPTSPA